MPFSNSYMKPTELLPAGSQGYTNIWFYEHMLGKAVRKGQFGISHVSRPGVPTEGQATVLI